MLKGIDERKPRGFTNEGAKTLVSLILSIRENPDWCASEHSRAIGVSRERVRQLRVEHGLVMPKKDAKHRSVRWRGE